MAKYDELKNFPLLKNLTDDDLKALEGYVTEVNFNENDDIIKEGEIGDTLYLLIEGKVDVIKTTIFDDEFICASLNSDMHCLFGEMAVIDNDKRSATIKAKTPCKTLSLNKEGFEEYCNKYPKAGIELLKMMNINIVRNLRIENENLKLVYQALIEEIEND
ncbi:MAG: cyclic nucleotide-binding domain-containing protein [Acholeplasmatales bacterium]|nr:cyclic nucleotide-binding domain-containing protein [Acholeplasmatales bacterium]